MSLPKPVQLPLFPPTKRCTACGITKDLAEFATQKHGRYGRRARCKACQALDSRQRRQARIGGERPYTPCAHKRCPQCGQDKPAEAFGRDKHRADGLTNACNECRAARADGWRKTSEYRAWWTRYRATHAEKLAAANRALRVANPERYKAYSACWRKRNPDKVRDKLRRYLDQNREKANIWQRKYRAVRKKAPGTHTKEDLDALFAQQSGRCAYCDAVLAWPIHVDHKIPLSRGGSNWPDNLCLACEGCNKRKWRMTDAEYRAHLARQP